MRVCGNAATHSGVKIRVRCLLERIFITGIQIAISTASVPGGLASFFVACVRGVGARGVISQCYPKGSVPVVGTVGAPAHVVAKFWALS